nr:sulfotransferase [Sphingosinicella soli]
MNAIGRTIAHGGILKVLVDRLRAEALFAAHPEIRDRPLAPPLVICGHMRSGTTRLQRLLACDDRFAHLRLYETLSPVPWPRSFTARRDPRIRWAGLGVRFLNGVNPANAAAHPTGPLEPEEETGLLEHSFWGAQIEAQRRVPAFARHCEQADARAVYRRFADLLRLAGWFRGDDPNLPWLLKSPQYLQDLPSLSTALPGARFIFMTRETNALVASGASLVWNQMVVQSDTVDPAWIGREWLHKTALRDARAAAFRAALPDARAFTLTFEDMNRDRRGTIRRLYDWLGLPLGEALTARMEAYAAREHRHVGHRYALADFGLTPQAVTEAMAASSPAYRPSSTTAGAAAAAR